MTQKCCKSRNFGFKLEDFITWLQKDFGAKFDLSSIGSPLAQYIVQTHKTIWAEVTLDYYWIYGKGYVRRGFLPYWALATNARLAHQVETNQINSPFTSIDVLVVLRGM